MTTKELKTTLDETLITFSKNMLELDGFDEGSERPATMADLRYFGSEMNIALTEITDTITKYLESH